MSEGHGASIGLIGCGHWGALILSDLLSLHCDVTVLARSPESVARARTIGAAHVVSSLDEMPAVAGYVVASPTNSHFTVICDLLKKFPGASIFTEKAMTTNISEAKHLAQHSCGRLFIMDKWRYHPGILKLAEIARSGEYGSVVGLRTVRTDWGSRHRDVDPVQILLSHDLSIAFEIFGHIPEPQSAVGVRSGDDLVHLVATLGPSPWFSIEVGALSCTKVRTVELFLEGGVAYLPDPMSNEVRVLLRGRGWDVNEKREDHFPISTEMPLLLELQAFLNFLCGKGPAPKSSVDEGALIVERMATLREMALGQR